MIPTFTLAFAILLQSNAGIRTGSLLPYLRVRVRWLCSNVNNVRFRFGHVFGTKRPHPNKFAYGFLGAFNLLPKIVSSEVNIIQAAGNMRGQALHI